MNKKIFVFVFLLFAFAQFAFAMDDLMALQGTVDSSGLPVSGNLTITIWDSSSGGTLLFNSSHDFDNKVINGRFDIVLGTMTPLTLSYGTYYYMDMNVNGQDLSFNGSNRQIFQSNIGNVSKQFVNVAGTWSMSDIPSLSSLWSGTIDASKIANAQNLNVNSSAYLGSISQADVLNNDSRLASQINGVNTSSNIKSLGFNITSELDLKYYLASNPSGYVGTAGLSNYYLKTEVYNRSEVYNKTEADNKYYLQTNPTQYITTANLTGYLTGTNLSNYYTKTQTYNKTEVYNKSEADNLYYLATNPSSFITASVNSLVNYYLKTEVYNMTEVYSKSETYNDTEVYNKTETDNKYYNATNPTRFITSTDANNTYSDQGSYQCADTVGTKLVNITLNNSGVYGNCVSDPGAGVTQSYTYPFDLIKNGTWYSNYYSATALTTVAMTANALWCSPYITGKSHKIDMIALRVTTLVNPSAISVAIYNDTGNLYPDVLQTNGSNQSSATATVKNDTLTPITLSSNSVYWLCIQSTATPTVTAIPLASVNTILGHDGTLSNNMNTLIRVASTYNQTSPWKNLGRFPAGAVLVTNTAPPMVQMRARTDI